MTREEAIKLIEHISVAFVPTDQYGDYDDPEPYEEALNMAIEALSAMCDDCIWRICNYNKINWDGEEGYISRKDVIDKAILVPIAKVVPEDKVIYRRVVFIEDIESLPSVDRPTGEWIECESNHVEKIYLCSNCQTYEAWGETEKTPYCPNCGAKMNKGGDLE